ncbi:MAG TPA: S8 family serine peptidase [Acidobacteriota bacterium]|nr:S8 family serine peptidase [Acidobacteriota bacterium]
MATVFLFLGLTLQAQQEDFRRGRVLVQPRAGLSSAQLSSILGAQGGRSTQVLSSINLHVVELPATANEEAVARALSRNPQIQFAELDWLIEPEVTTANDPMFDNAWHLSRIRAPEAWDLSVGQGITVAVLDTGVDPDHPDLSPQLVPGWNLYDNNADTSDVYGHGTKVAGVVAALSNNGLGVTSIAWSARVMPVRISRPDGAAYVSTIAQGLTWAADHGADVANISYRVSHYSSVRSAAEYLRSLGGITVVSAGNSHGYEAFAPNPSVLAISATTSSDALASFSSYGEYVDLSAPGSGIWTTTNGGGYGAPSGTSFSSPVTAAVVALMMAVNPSLTPPQLEDLLFSTALDLGASGYDIYFGHGRVDAAAAVAAAAGLSDQDSTPPSVSIVSPAGGTVSGVVAVDVSASDNVQVSSVELFAQGSWVGTDPTAPYQFSWDSSEYPDGPASLQAFAYDPSGNQGSSPPVELEVDNVPDAPDTVPPVVAIASPSDGQVVTKNVHITVEASDDRGLSQVQLSIDGNVVLSGTSGLSYSWNTRREASGAHLIEARAWDEAGNFASHSVEVQISDGGKGSKGKGKNK